MRFLCFLLWLWCSVSNADVDACCGFEEAMRIAKAEVEVVMLTEATAASLGGLPASAASGVGYMAYKVGGKFYLTAQKAWTALVKINPSLEIGAVKNAFGNWLEGRGVAKAEVAGLKGQVKPFGAKGDLINLPRPQESLHYSCIFKAELKEGAHYPGKSRGIHFQEANKQLYNRIMADQVFATNIERLYPGIRNAVSPGARGAFSSRSPLNLTWHHSAHDRGVLELIPRSHHQASGLVQNTLHPNNRGGQMVWGE